MLPCFDFTAYVGRRYRRFGISVGAGGEGRGTRVDAYDRDSMRSQFRASSSNLERGENGAALIPRDCACDTACVCMHAYTAYVRVCVSACVCACRLSPDVLYFDGTTYAFLFLAMEVFF